MNECNLSDKFPKCWKREFLYLQMLGIISSSLYSDPIPAFGDSLNILFLRKVVFLKMID